MDRRAFLGSAILGAAWFGLPGCAREDDASSLSPFINGPAGKRRMIWRNWSGRLHEYPAVRAAPQDEDELRKLHESAHRKCFIANSVKTEIVVEPVMTATAV